jgi:CheY-like chemotaxis protein
MNKSNWILLAEDDAPLAELTALALAPEQLGCEVIVARDGLETLDCLHHCGEFRTRAVGDPVFVLLDVKMPKVDGLEVLRQIKSDARFKYIPVVMFSSSRELNDVRRSYQSGANAYIVKPMDFRQFSNTLQRVGQFWAMLNELPPEAESAEMKTREHQQLAVAI